MTIEDRLDDFGSRLDRRIASRRAQWERDSAELAAAYRGADAEQQSRVEAQRAVRSEQSLLWRRPPWEEPGGDPTQPRIGLWQIETLQRLDRLMWAAFDLEGVFGGQPLARYPVVYCETLEEFFRPMLAAEDISETTRAQVLQALILEAEEKAAEGSSSVLGFNLPGHGCYVNGWLFGFLNDKSPRRALQDERIFPQVLRVVCHEKLGHGFLSELTSAGQEKTRLGLWRFDLARRFSARTVDDPRAALLGQKNAYLHRTTQFTEEGWATWIETYMLWRAVQDGLLAQSDAPAQPHAQYTLEQVGNLLQRVGEGAPDLGPRVKRLSDAMELLLVGAEGVSASAILEAVRMWQVDAPLLDGTCVQMLGQPAVYVLGYLLLRRLEAELGWQNLPYAIAIAGNVTYDLERIPLTDLQTLVAQDVRLNVDGRLALLATLNLPPGQGAADLARLAREALNLAVPEGWPC